MIYRSTTSFLLAVTGVVFVGCATSQSSSRSGDSSIASTQAEGAPKVSSRAKLLFEDAVKAIDGAELESVQLKFERAAQADSNLAEAEYNLGVIAEKKGDTQRAARHYKRALRSKPSLTPAAVNLAVIAQNSGDVARAEEIYRSISENDKGDAASRARLAELARRRGDHDQAVDLAREALYRDPNNVVASKVMMRTFLETREYTKARLMAFRTQKLAQNDPEIHYVLGQVLMQRGETDAAREEFKKSVNLQPDFVLSYVNLANLALKDKNYREAEDSLRKVMQYSGESAEGQLNLGVALKGMGKLDEAIAAYDRARSLDSGLAPVYYNKGIVLALKGDAPAAIDSYKQYLQLSGGIGSDHPVYGLIDEAQAQIAAKEEAEAAMREAERLEAEMARKEKEAKEAELKKQLENAKGKGGKAATPPAPGGEANVNGKPKPDTLESAFEEGKPSDSGEPDDAL